MEPADSWIEAFAKHDSWLHMLGALGPSSACKLQSCSRNCLRYAEHRALRNAAVLRAALACAASPPNVKATTLVDAMVKSSIDEAYFRLANFTYDCSKEERDQICGLVFCSFCEAARSCCADSLTRGRCIQIALLTCSFVSQNPLPPYGLIALRYVFKASTMLDSPRLVHQVPLLRWLLKTGCSEKMFLSCSTGFECDDIVRSMERWASSKRGTALHREAIELMMRAVLLGATTSDVAATNAVLGAVRTCRVLSCRRTFVRDSVKDDVLFPTLWVVGKVVKCTGKASAALQECCQLAKGHKLSPGDAALCMMFLELGADPEPAISLLKFFGIDGTGSRVAIDCNRKYGLASLFSTVKMAIHCPDSKILRLQLGSKSIVALLTKWYAEAFGRHSQSKSHRHGRSPKESKIRSIAEPTLNGYSTPRLRLGRRGGA